VVSLESEDQRGLHYSFQILKYTTEWVAEDATPQGCWVEGGKSGAEVEKTGGVGVYLPGQSLLGKRR